MTLKQLIRKFKQSAVIVTIVNMVQIGSKFNKSDFPKICKKNDHEYLPQWPKNKIIKC